jgi:DNA-binding transcriptional ArsR family regulator/uncharacterized protein YndB with AHSA1/START domain
VEPARSRDIQKVIAALSAPVRREILALVWDRELPAGEIAAAFELTKPTISQHLAVLRDAGLVTMTAAGTSRRYRAVQEALAGLDGALAGATKWVPADHAPERSLAQARVLPVVVASVDVDTGQHATFAALTDSELYSRWLGVPVRIRDGRFAATMEWGTEVRGRYELVVPPELIVMSWDLDDGNVPVPGGQRTGYLRVTPRLPFGAHVEVHQLAGSVKEAELLSAAWRLVLGRLRAGVGPATDPAIDMRPRLQRPKRHRHEAE